MAGTGKSLLYSVAEAVVIAKSIESKGVKIVDNILYPDEELMQRLRMRPLPPPNDEVEDPPTLNCITYSDGARTLFATKVIEEQVRELIFKYASNMEWAIRVNEALRGKTDDPTGRTWGNRIAEAIASCGLSSSKPVCLWRKAGLHDDDVDKVPAVRPQSTIISTSNDSSVLVNWRGAFAYCIMAREFEKFLVVRHKIIGGTFDEYLLGPGHFCYTQLGPTMFVTYATSDSASRYEYFPEVKLKGIKAMVRWKPQPL